MERIKTSASGKCFSMWLITAQIIAHNFSDYSTIWESRQRLKITSSTSMTTRSCFLRSVYRRLQNDEQRIHRSSNNRYQLPRVKSVGRTDQAGTRQAVPVWHASDNRLEGG